MGCLNKTLREPLAGGDVQRVDVIFTAAGGIGADVAASGRLPRTAAVRAGQALAVLAEMLAGAF